MLDNRNRILSAVCYGLVFSCMFMAIVLSLMLWKMGAAAVGDYIFQNPLKVIISVMPGAVIVAMSKYMRK